MYYRRSRIKQSFDLKLLEMVQRLYHGSNQKRSTGKCISSKSDSVRFLLTFSKHFLSYTIIVMVGIVPRIDRIIKAVLSILPLVKTSYLKEYYEIVG